MTFYIDDFGEENEFCEDCGCELSEKAIELNRTMCFDCYYFHQS